MLQNSSEEYESFILDCDHIKMVSIIKKTVEVRTYYCPVCKKREVIERDVI